MKTFNEFSKKRQKKKKKSLYFSLLHKKLKALKRVNGDLCSPDDFQPVYNFKALSCTPSYLEAPISSSSHINFLYAYSPVKITTGNKFESNYIKFYKSLNAETGKLEG